MQHRGEIVERAVRHSGMPLTQLTKKLGKSRRWIYNAFDNPMLSIELILEIGKHIHHDFSQEIDGIQRTFQISSDPSVSYAKEANEQSAEFWKNKYLLLLEKYNELLEGRGGLGKP
jgi:hypothetical protein